MHFAIQRARQLISGISGKRSLRPALLLTGVMGLTLLAARFGAGVAQAANLKFHYQRGYYVDNGWLCYGWANGMYHCTQHWYRAANGTLVSQNPTWVPNNASVNAAAPAKAAPATSAPVKKAPAAKAPAKMPAKVHAKAPAKAPFKAAPRVPAGSVQSQIVAVFGKYANAALAVARCESGFNPNARNARSGAAGVFQFLHSTWLTTSYAGSSPFNASANIHAAYQVFARDGFSWREWQCRA